MIAGPMIAGLAVFLIVVCAVLWLFSRLAVLLLERRFAPTGSLLDFPFGRVHVVDQPAARPDAPCVVLIHGAAGNLRDLLHALSGHLAGRFRIIVIDRPGHGFSTRRDPVWSEPRRQAEALDAVLARLGVDRAIVVGQSWGGAFAAAFALRYPKRIQGLVFVSPATHPWPSGIGWHIRVGALPVVGRLFAELAAMPIGLALIPGALRGIFGPNAVPPDYRARIGAALVLRPRTFVANCRDIADFYGHVTAMAAHYDRIGAPTENLEPADAFRAYASVVRRDAEATLAAVELVRSREAVSSQLVDNLNASIHVRALLTDLFLVDDLLG